MLSFTPILKKFQSMRNKYSGEWGKKEPQLLKYLSVYKTLKISAICRRMLGMLYYAVLMQCLKRVKEPIVGVTTEMGSRTLWWTASLPSALDTEVQSLKQSLSRSSISCSNNQVSYNPVSSWWTWLVKHHIIPVH